jgi:hypothetical protein
VACQDLNLGPHPYQAYSRSYIPTPPFPDYVSGHSTFSAAAGQVIRTFTGSDTLNLTSTFAAGSSFVEPAASRRPQSSWAGQPSAPPPGRPGCHANTVVSTSVTPTPTASTWDGRSGPTPGTRPTPTSKASPPAELGSMPQGGPLREPKFAERIKAVQHHLSRKSASITLDRYGHLFPEELDHLVDRLHAQAVVYPACTDASWPPSDKAKGPGR